MPDVSFTNLLVISVVAVLAPLVVGFVPRLRIPAVVLEIVAGIVLGPSVLGWVHVDLPVQILALLGLAFLLFLAGLEIDARRLRGRVLRLAVLGYLVTLVLGAGAGFAFGAIGWVRSPSRCPPRRSAWWYRCSRTPARSTARWGRARSPPPRSPTSPRSCCCRCSSPRPAAVPAPSSSCSSHSRPSSWRRGSRSPLPAARCGWARYWSGCRTPPR